jgi:hypothetical protein
MGRGTGPGSARRAPRDDRDRRRPGRHRGRERGVAALRPGERRRPRGRGGSGPRLLRDLSRRDDGGLPTEPPGANGHRPRAPARAADLQPRLRQPRIRRPAVVHADGDPARRGRRGHRPLGHHRAPAHREVGRRPHRDRARAGRRPRAGGRGPPDRDLGGPGVRRPAFDALPPGAGDGAAPLHRGRGRRRLGDVARPDHDGGRGRRGPRGGGGAVRLDARRARRPEDLAAGLGPGAGARGRVPLGARDAAQGGRSGHRGPGPGRRGGAYLHRGRAGPARRVRGPGRGGPRELGSVPRDPGRAGLPPVHHRPLPGRDRHHRRAGAGDLLQPGSRGDVRLPRRRDDRGGGGEPLSGRDRGGAGGTAASRPRGSATELRDRLPRQGRPPRRGQRVDRDASRPDRRGGRHPRGAQGHRGAAPSGGAAPPVPEDGRDRAPRRGGSPTTSTTCSP